MTVCNKTKNQSYYSQQEKNKLGKQAPRSLKSLEHTGSAQLVGGDFCKIGSHLLPLTLLGILVTESPSPCITSPCLFPLAADSFAGLSYLRSWGGPQAQPAQAAAAALTSRQVSFKKNMYTKMLPSPIPSQSHSFPVPAVSHVCLTHPIPVQGCRCIPQQHKKGGARLLYPPKSLAVLWDAWCPAASPQATDRKTFFAPAE